MSAEQREIHAAAGGWPVDGGDDQLGHVGDGSGDFFAGQDELFDFGGGFAVARVAQKFDIAAGAEGAPGCR